ncbi:MAG: hypothetical protein K2P80_07215 [Beijerinckiaceae bacterium]|nr:hypothetical protein [Beijerinckiaceae bacterium]
MIGSRKMVDVPCTVEIVQTPDSLAAHVTLDGFDVGPGDKVIVHNPPTSIGFGEQATFNCRATVYPAGPIGRGLTKALAYLELTELYEIGFSAGSAS